MADDAAPLMHVDWLRTFEAWRQELQTPIEINVEQIIGGGQPLTRVNDTNVTATLTGTPLTALLKPVTITLGWSGTLALSRGGTAAALTAVNGGLVYSTASALAITAAGTSGDIIKSGGAGTPTWNTPAALTKVDDTNVTVTLGGSAATALVNAASLTLGWTGTLGVARGGTNLSSYAVGDLLYASGATTLSKLADVAAGSYLRSGGVTTAPLWSTLTLPNASATGDLVYASSANTMAVRTIGSSNDVLTVSGGVPTWAAASAVATNVTITDDTTTNATVYPTWVTANTGNLPLKVTSTKLSFNPSTGALALATALAVTSGGTGTGTAFTLGSVVFAGTSGVYTQDNANFFWDDTNNRLAIGTTSPNSPLHIKSTSAFPVLNIESTTASGGVLQLTSSTNNWQIENSNGNIRFDVNVVAPTGTKLLLSNNGLLQIGTTASIATATACLFLGDGTAPTAGIMPANTGALYVDSFGTSGLFGIDAGGIITRLTAAARGRSTAQTAAVASVAAFTLGAADTSFIVSAVVTVTTSTTHNFTVAVDYTDETNTAQTLTLTFSQLAGAFITAITNLTGAGPYEGIPLQIRCKASTAITMKTVGTFTIVTYNVEGLFRQVSG